MIEESEKIELFKKVVTTLDENNIGYWIEFGTLLGFVREGKIIPWDNDIDLVSLEFDKVKKIIPVLNKKGLKTKIIYDNTPLTTILKIYLTDDFHLDIYNMKQGYEGIIFKTNRYISKPAKFFRHFFIRTRSKLLQVVAVWFSNKMVFVFPFTVPKEATFYGIKTYIPDNPENHLELYYGKRWKTPIKEDCWVCGKKENLVKIENNVSYYKLGG